MSCGFGHELSSSSSHNATPTQTTTTPPRPVQEGRDRTGQIRAFVLASSAYEALIVSLLSGSQISNSPPPFPPLCHSRTLGELRALPPLSQTGRRARMRPCDSCVPAAALEGSASGAPVAMARDRPPREAGDSLVGRLRPSELNENRFLFATAHRIGPPC